VSHRECRPTSEHVSIEREAVEGSLAEGRGL